MSARLPEDDDRVPRTAQERAALGRLAEIDNDPTHASHHADDPNHAAGVAEKLRLWRVAMGSRNRPVTTYREEGDPPVIGR